MSRKLSGAAIADIVGGCIILVPFLGIFSPGFWQLDPSAVTVSIPPPAGYASPAPLPYSNPGPAYIPPKSAAPKTAPATSAPPSNTGGTYLPPQRQAH